MSRVKCYFTITLCVKEKFGNSYKDISDEKFNEVVKYILLIIIVLFTVVFWEKITEIVYKKFNIRLNYIIVSAVLITIAIIVLLVNYF